MTEVKMPEPEYMGCDSVGDIFAYTEDQLKQYGDDRAREALELAVKVVEADLWPGPVHDYQKDYNNGVKSLAKKVRALTKEIK